MALAAQTTDLSGRNSPAALTEQELEFLTGQCGTPCKTATEYRRLWQEENWNALLLLADRHGLVPLLYQSADSLGMPAAPLSKLRRMFDANACQALRLTGELFRILDVLDVHGIVTLPYKGPVLAQSLYGNVAMRQFSDLDILVHASDIPRIKQALLPLGYTVGLQLTPREERSYLASGYEYAFDSVLGKNLLEIQWRILPRFYSIEFNMEGLFQRCVAVQHEGREVRSLCAEDLLLVLCAHSAKHLWLQLSWLRDIAELVRSRTLDWDFVQRQVRDLGLERIVNVTFCLAERFFGEKITSDKRFLCDAQTSRLSDDIFEVVRNGVDYDTESIHYFRLMMRLRERRWDRLRFLRRLVFTPSVGEWQAVKLPERLFPMYGAVRLFRLGRRMSVPARAR